MPDPLLESFETFLRRSVEQPGTSHFVAAAGIRMHYLEWQGPPGAPVVAVHGFLAHAHWWDFLAPWLATEYRVIAPDFGGMGDSGYRERYQYADFHCGDAGTAASPCMSASTSRRTSAEDAPDALPRRVRAAQQARRSGDAGAPGNGCSAVATSC